MKISKPIQYVIAVGGLLILGLLGWNAYSAPAAKASPTPVAQKAKASAPAVAFYNAVNKATNAAQLTQTAKTKAQWNTVATNWQQAIALMKAVPKANSNHKVAQQKVVEYQNNLNYAQQASANAK
jgi:hypothetical protein